MNAQQLKNAILQEAIQGRLVPQDPNDEPASVLLDRIRKEKAKLVKEGKLKKKDLEEKPISEDEIPFEIPDSWEWVRLGELIIYQNGYAYNSSDMNKERKGVPVIKSGNLMTLEVELKPNNDYIEHPNEKMLASKIVKGDMLMCLSSQSDNPEPLGKTAIYKFDAYALLNQRVLKFRPFFDELSIYLYYTINSFYFWYNVSHQGGGSAQANLKLSHVLGMPLPLPPLAEQQRIVAKIEELLLKVEEYGKAQEALDKLNEELPERLKKSVLQEAIQGRLVPQDPNDEPAPVLLDRIRKEKVKLVKEGKLKKKDLEEKSISEEEIPFEIPDSWEWVRLENITTYICRGKSPVYSEIKKYPIVAQKCNQWSGFSLEKAKFADPNTIAKYTEERLLQDGDLLWNSTGLGTLGRMAIYDSNANPYGWAVADSHVTVIRTRPEFCNYKYLYYYFTSHHVQSVIEDKSEGSTKQKELSQDTVRNYEIPLPPLAEQQSIVKRIEQLFNEIAKLK